MEYRTLIASVHTVADGEFAKLLHIEYYSLTKAFSAFVRSYKSMSRVSYTSQLEARLALSYGINADDAQEQDEKSISALALQTRTYHNTIGTAY
jgi:hypothetical protein